MIPVPYLKECFDVGDDGRLVWKVRPAHHFVVPHRCAAFNAQRAGKAAGRINHFGYYSVNLTVDQVVRKVLAHRIVWAMHYGEWPNQVIDHINHVRNDNRIVNLRDVSNAENMRNRAPGSRSSCGATGVYSKDGKFLARITVHHKRHHLGTFPTLELAKAAYQKARIDLAGEQA